MASVLKQSSEVQMVLRIVIPMFPPSVNAIYTVKPQYLKGGKMRMGIGLTAEARRWVFDAQYFMPPRQLDGSGETLYYLSIDLYTNWLNKDGTLKRKDVGNYEKLITDALFNRYHLDDKLVWYSSVSKYQSPKDQVILMLSTLGNLKTILSEQTQPKGNAHG